MSKAQTFLSKETELNKSLEELQKELKKLQENKVIEARKAAEKIIADFGLEVSDVFDLKSKKATKKTINTAPKYKLNEKEWSGRGARPKWVVEYIDNGGDLKDIETA